MVNSAGLGWRGFVRGYDCVSRLFGRIRGLSPLDSSLFISRWLRALLYK